MANVTLKSRKSRRTAKISSPGRQEKYRLLETLTKKQIEAVNSSFSENALKMMKKRYLQMKENGERETPAEMFGRIARSLAAVEKNYGKRPAQVRKLEREFFEVMTRKEYTPAGRTVTNAGSITPVVANCIVLPVEDNMESIFQTLKDAALLQQSGSGLGFDFSFLRPAYFPTVRTQGEASGPVAFLQIYNVSFGIIKQQRRHGANMAMVNVHHPDVLDFINCKAAEGEIRNFNISVQLTDAFMKAVTEKPDEQWYCEWKGKKMKPRRVLRAPSGHVMGAEEVNITAKELFDEIVDRAWRNGEPGVFFIDEVNRKANPLPGLGPITCTNPCGEQPLHPYDNCNLGSINLAAFVKKRKVDWTGLKKVTRVAVRMQDNVIDTFDFPVPTVTELAHKNRRIGLGVMGFADMLFELGIGYNSTEGVRLAERVMETINDEAHKMSQLLAKEKGEFPNIELSIYGKKYGKKKTPMRNAALTTIAPTGSISMFFDTSSGIEPVFALAYVKQDKDAQKYHYLNRYFESALHQHGIPKKKIDEIKDEVIKKGTIQHLTYLPDQLRRTFMVAMDISAKDHMAMQAAFQKHVDNSISKTINFPNSATREDVAEGYISAWKLGCLSCTVYRDGSREVQVLNLGDGTNIKGMHDLRQKKESGPGIGVSTLQESKSATNGFHPKARPEVMSGKTYRVRTGYGNLYVTVNNDESGRPFEVFATIGKTGGFFQEQSEALCRMISTALRAGVSVKEIIAQLKGIRGPMPTLTEKGTVLSLPDAIGQMLEEHIGVAKLNHLSLFESEPRLPDGQAPAAVLASSFPAETDPKKQIADYGYMPGCPECGGKLQRAEGCMNCPMCGWNRCG